MCVCACLRELYNVWFGHCFCRSFPNDELAQIQLEFERMNEQTQRLKALRSDSVGLQVVPSQPVGAQVPTAKATELAADIDPVASQEVTVIPKTERTVDDVGAVKVEAAAVAEVLSIV